MEVELEPRVKALNYKVKGISRETPSQKAAHVIDTDLRNHWSTATNTKEWILLELDEPCLLSHIRLYNKSVLEWEIAAGLSYKPETFVKVRPRCEAPRRDMMYPMNYTPCRYVRISCLRGNPIAIFFIQLIGVSVAGLVPEFQPVVNHLLPHIMSHKQDTHDMHLQLLQDMTNRLLLFLPQLEMDLTNFSDAAESNIRFLAMLAGPFYPILHIVNERETAKCTSNISDSEVSKNNHSLSAVTVSSNFEPRRLRSTSPLVLSTSSSIALSPDAILVLLRKAYKDSNLGTVCRTASRILQRLIEPVCVQEESNSSEIASALEETSKSELSIPITIADYSNLFGEEFQILDDHWDSTIVNILDIGSVEEGILHVLYACASQPELCSKLAESTSDIWSALPLVQALLPALRPCVSSPSEHPDNSFSHWKQSFVQQALSQIVATLSSPSYCSLLHACAGFLSSFSPSHVKAACVLIDLCSSVLAPWMVQVIAKIDLTVELIEDLLGIIQGARHHEVRARAALKYIVFALSGHMDDIMGKYKEVKHRILFLVEMLEPFLDPAMYALKSSIGFGDVSLTFLDRHEHTCMIALNIIRTAVQKPAVLPYLESEWRRGSVAPSVILSILEPHMQLPPEIDLCKAPVSKTPEQGSSTFSSLLSVHHNEGVSSKANSQDEFDGKTDPSDTAVKMDIYEDVSLFFAPPELQTMALKMVSSSLNEKMDSKYEDANAEPKHAVKQKFARHLHDHLVLDAAFAAEYFTIQADYSQLVNYRDCELKASEFQRLATDLQSQPEITVEGHEAAIDALLLAAECYVNPFFVASFRTSPKVMNQMDIRGTEVPKCSEVTELRRASGKNSFDLLTVAHLEKKRDKVVLQILLEAAELDRKYQKRLSDGGLYNTEGFDEQVIKLSPLDMQSADAITLARQNQALLCNFLIRRLQREQYPVHEILLQYLVFLLHSATKLYCAPEDVIKIILRSAEYLNGMLTSFYHQSKEGNLQLNPEKIHGVQRYWILLQRLVIASTGGDEGSDVAVNINTGVQHGNLIPPSAWMQEISTFSSCASPLVRFLGWMAISRNAKQYLNDHLFLASDLSQLTYLLSIFADELSIVDNFVDQKHENVKIEHSGVKKEFHIRKGVELVDQQFGDPSFHVIYPDLCKFIPNMKKQFEAFGESILEAVGLQLRSLSSSILPDVLCWFSDLCCWPFSRKDQMNSLYSSDHFKGYVAKNAKAIVLYVLEAIVIEHMEAMVPEIPRVVHVLVSLCRASYCDVSFLESVLHLLKPIISYSLYRASDEEKLLVNDFCLNFESLCFDELFTNIKQKNENQDTEKVYNRALTIYILASVFPDLSFQRRREILQSLTLWTDFSAFEPTTYFHEYLCAFQCVMESCKVVLVHTFRYFGLIPLQLPQLPEVSWGTLSDKSAEVQLWFLNELSHRCSSIEISEMQESENLGAVPSKQKNHHLSAEEIEDFCKDLESVIAKLFLTIELCWTFHHQLAKKLTISSAQCFVYCRCLMSVAQIIQNANEDDGKKTCPYKSNDVFPVHLRIGLDGLVKSIEMLQENHCWEVASTIVDCLLTVPHSFHPDNVIGTLCSAIKSFSCSAPKLAWRLQTDKWFSRLFAGGVQSLHESEIPLADLFCTMLGHPEPEQRFIALKHLSQLVGQDMNRGIVIDSSTFCNTLVSHCLVPPANEPILAVLVSSTWDQVVVLTSSDTSLPLRTHAMALLVDYVPYADRHQLQSFLAAADSVLLSLGNPTQPICEGPSLKLSLALIASACLYAPAEDIPLIPQSVWKNIETLGFSKTEGRLGESEKKACQVLCRLRNEGDGAKEVLKEVLSSNSSIQFDKDFGSTRESILQVLANLTSVQSYFDFFSKKVDQEDMELEEAELELDIVQREHAQLEPSIDSKEGSQIPCLDDSVKDDNRLQQIKDCIRSLDRSKLRQDIVSRRQKKHLLRRARQKSIEEAALREAELLQELDRDRAAEVEKEIERQRLLELERAKTRELRHNLDMEKERQVQRELQRELEQAESGLRSSRRDISSSAHNSRPRDRYRERENGRSGQPPTILQSRDRSDDCGSSYEENLDGSKDSGDTGSVGDPDSVSAFDGQSSGFGSAQRHGSRAGKSRQGTERRERESRREGKWERKHS
ncbi:hypothetical protein CFOL_v3_08834 [Cephalotus follicularis]|uniref:Uncharacterized protein n=1 Tax=Cephalotus follicularis TaxID=3775 RepID=A0A1Q3BBM6_CEPFO|nr:hypothetical protein CFOL_v3_08834 [Cephalotus follicularis]